MTTQPKALELADAMDSIFQRQAADELRRLHAEVESLKLAEEGAKEAYGVLVDDKRDLKKELDRMTELHRSNLDMTRNALREKMRLHAENEELSRALSLQAGVMRKLVAEHEALIKGSGGSGGRITGIREIHGVRAAIAKGAA